MPKTTVQNKSIPQNVSVETVSPIQSQISGTEFGSSVVPSLPDTHQPGRISVPAPADRTSLQLQPQEYQGSNVGHVTQHQSGFNESQYRAELTKQNYEVELKGMVGKMQDVENEKYKVEIEMANKVAELETKVRNIKRKQDFFFQSERGLKVFMKRNFAQRFLDCIGKIS